MQESKEAKVKEFQEWLEVRNFSTETVSFYVFYAHDFLNYLDKDHTELAQSDIEAYLVHYRQRAADKRKLRKERKGKRLSKDGDRRTGISYNVVAALFKFYESLNIQIDRKSLRIRQSKRLEPRVLSEDEVQRLLCAEMTLRTKALITLLLSSGLRISEASRLRYSDIDEKTLTVKVRHGKGSKSRTTIISTQAIGYIKQHQAACRTEGIVSRFVFAGSSHDLPANKRGLQNILSAEFERLDIDATAHTLRHTFATRLLAKGVDLKTIQQLLGHSSLETSSIYLHVGAKDIKVIASQKLFDSMESVR